MVKINKTNRVEQTIIKESHPLYKTIEDFSIRSNNFYNYANWHTRKAFIDGGEWKKATLLQSELKTHEPYKKLMSQSSQCVLRVLEKNWKSFFVANKDYNLYPAKYFKRPRLPSYRQKGGKFVWYLKNNQTYIKDGKLYFRLKAMKGFGFKTSVTGRLISVRFIPKNGVFVLEIIYEKEYAKKENFNNNIASIDLGVDNLVTMVNNVGLPPVIVKGKIVKSINQFYNKSRAKYQGGLPKDVNWSKRLDEITLSRFNKIKNYMHHTTAFIVKYCKENNIDNIVIGRNKRWKQEKKYMQNFTFIPYNMIIRQLEYKCKENGINFILTREAYTSGTSFLDNELPIKQNYNKRRRIERGLFKSNNGVLINADVNGAYQIGRKVFPNAFESYGIEGCLSPVVYNDITNSFNIEK